MIILRLEIDHLILVPGFVGAAVHAIASHWTRRRDSSTVLLASTRHAVDWTSAGQAGDASMRSTTDSPGSSATGPW